MKKRGRQDLVVAGQSSELLIANSTCIILILIILIQYYPTHNIAFILSFANYPFCSGGSKRHRQSRLRTRSLCSNVTGAQTFVEWVTVFPLHKRWINRVYSRGRGTVLLQNQVSRVEVLKFELQSRNLYQNYQLLLFFFFFRQDNSTLFLLIESFSFLEKSPFYEVFLNLCFSQAFSEFTWSVQHSLMLPPWRICGRGCKSEITLKGDFIFVS